MVKRKTPCPEWLICIAENTLANAGKDPVSTDDKIVASTAAIGSKHPRRRYPVPSCRRSDRANRCSHIAGGRGQDLGEGGAWHPHGSREARQLPPKDSALPVCPRRPYLEEIKPNPRSTQPVASHHIRARSAVPVRVMPTPRTRASKPTTSARDSRPRNATARAAR